MERQEGTTGELRERNKEIRMHLFEAKGTSKVLEVCGNDTKGTAVSFSALVVLGGFSTQKVKLPKHPDDGWWKWKIRRLAVNRISVE